MADSEDKSNAGSQDGEPKSDDEELPEALLVKKE